MAMATPATPRLDSAKEATATKPVQRRAKRADGVQAWSEVFGSLDASAAMPWRDASPSMKRTKLSKMEAEWELAKGKGHDVEAFGHARLAARWNTSVHAWYRYRRRRTKESTVQKASARTGAAGAVGAVGAMGAAGPAGATHVRVSKRTVDEKNSEAFDNLVANCERRIAKLLSDLRALECKLHDSCAANAELSCELAAARGAIPALERGKNRATTARGRAVAARMLKAATKEAAEPLRLAKVSAEKQVLHAERRVAAAEKRRAADAKKLKAAEEAASCAKTEVRAAKRAIKKLVQMKNAAEAKERSAKRARDRAEEKVFARNADIEELIDAQKKARTQLSKAGPSFFTGLFGKPGVQPYSSDAKRMLFECMATGVSASTLRGIFRAMMRTAAPTIREGIDVRVPSETLCNRLRDVSAPLATRLAAASMQRAEETGVAYAAGWDATPMDTKQFLGGYTASTVQGRGVVRFAFPVTQPKSGSAEHEATAAIGQLGAPAIGTAAAILWKGANMAAVMSDNAPAAIAMSRGIVKEQTRRREERESMMCGANDPYNEDDVPWSDEEEEDDNVDGDIRSADGSADGSASDLLDLSAIVPGGSVHRVHLYSDAATQGNTNSRLRDAQRWQYAATRLQLALRSLWRRRREQLGFCRRTTRGRVWKQPCDVVLEASAAEVAKRRALKRKELRAESKEDAAVRRSTARLRSPAPTPPPTVGGGSGLSGTLSWPALEPRLNANTWKYTDFSEAPLGRDMREPWESFTSWTRAAAKLFGNFRGAASERMYYLSEKVSFQAWYARQQKKRAEEGLAAWPKLLPLLNIGKGSRQMVGTTFFVVFMLCHEQCLEYLYAMNPDDKKRNKLALAVERGLMNKVRPPSPRPLTNVAVAPGEQHYSPPSLSLPLSLCLLSLSFLSLSLSLATLLYRPVFYCRSSCSRSGCCRYH
jgi:hypothetical protein